MKTRYIALIFVVATALILSACGGAGNAPAASPTTTVMPTQQSAEDHYVELVKRALDSGDVPIYARVLVNNQLVNPTPCPACGPQVKLEDDGMVFVSKLSLKNDAFDFLRQIANAYVDVAKERGEKPDLYRLVHLYSWIPSGEWGGTGRVTKTDGGQWLDCNYESTGGCVLTINSGSAFIITDLANSCQVSNNGADVTPFLPMMGGYGAMTVGESTVEIRQGKVYIPNGTRYEVKKATNCWGSINGDVSMIKAGLAQFASPQDAVKFGAGMWDTVTSKKQNFANDHSFSNPGKDWILFTDLLLTGNAKVPACLTPLTGAEGSKLTDHGYGVFVAHRCSNLSITRGVGYELP